MLKFNGKTMKKAVVAEEFAVEDENFCISRTGGHDSVMAKPGMDLWIISEAECESYGSTEMSLCWIPKFGFATTLASKFVDYIPTESTEEREALDMTGTTSRQADSLVNNSELPNSSGWKSGDECRYNDINWLFCGFHPGNGLAIVANKDEPGSHQIITVDASLLSKPETPEQKAERERLEAAYDLYCEYTNTNNSDAKCYSQHAFRNLKVKCKWLSIVDKTGYRKAK